MAQAEHGDDSLVAVVSAYRDVLDEVAAELERLAPERPTVTEAPIALVQVANDGQAVALAEAIAPEHLQLIGETVEAEEVVGRVRRAGCVFVGAYSGTAFGDYVAGSNHVLPTGGAARYAGALSPSTFRRRMARVSLDDEAAARLAPAGAAIARAEGFDVHAESMESRT
jgi:histidinol dehydrogenase